MTPEDDKRSPPGKKIATSDSYASMIGPSNLQPSTIPQQVNQRLHQRRPQPKANSAKRRLNLRADTNRILLTIQDTERPFVASTLPTTFISSSSCRCTRSPLHSCRASKQHLWHLYQALAVSQHYRLGSFYAAGSEIETKGGRKSFVSPGTSPLWPVLPVKIGGDYSSDGDSGRGLFDYF